MTPVAAAYAIRKTAALLVGVVVLVAASLAGRDARANPAGSSAGRADGWTSPAWAGNAPLESLGGDGFRITLPGGRSWAAAVGSVEVDVDATPILAFTVAHVSPGASWVLKLGDAPYDVAHPIDLVTDPAGGVTPGRFLVDLREVSGGKWRGRMNLEVRLFVASNSGSGAVTFGDVRLLPAQEGRGSETNAHPSPGDALQVSSGVGTPWTLAYRPESGTLQLCRDGGESANRGLSIALPGFTEAWRQARGSSAIRFDSLKEMPGQNTRVIHCVTDEADYEVRFTAYTDRIGGQPDTMARFRWTVTATWRKPRPVFPALFPQSSAPECRYEFGQGAGPPLCVLSKHRFGQLGPETGQAFLPCDAALGASALYVQNLTALAPLFEATHASAAKTVFTVPEGFGFRSPPTATEAATGVVPASASLTLVDSFFAISNGGSADSAAPVDAARVYLHLLAAIYDSLRITHVSPVSRGLRANVEAHRRSIVPCAKSGAAGERPA